MSKSDLCLILFLYGFFVAMFTALGGIQTAGVVIVPIVFLSYFFRVKDGR